MRIFISSTYVDLKDIRQVAINFLQDLVGTLTDSTGKVVAMEFFAASERTCKEECLRELESSDLVIGIYGDAYGSVDENGISMTEIEFDFAMDHGIPVLGFVKRPVNRDERESAFIASKVHGRKISCANFNDVEDFANRLNDSLKEYLGTFDGYSFDSLWDRVSSLKKEIEGKIAAEEPGCELQMIPYAPGQEDAALDSIISIAEYLRGFIPDLCDENQALLDFEVTAKSSLFGIVKASLNLRKWLKSHPGIVLRNWGSINLGHRNHTTALLLAAMYLKLIRMQMRLLTEKWTEELRQEVVKVRTDYESIITKSHHVD